MHYAYATDAAVYYVDFGAQHTQQQQQKILFMWDARLFCNNGLYVEGENIIHRISYGYDRGT